MKNKSLEITWLGTAGIYLTDGTDSILIDPFVSRHGMFRVFAGWTLPSDPTLIKKWTEKLNIKNVRMVIVSHSHFDHAIDAPYFAKNTGAILAGSESTAWIGKSAGLNEKQIDAVKPGDTRTIGNFKIRFIESLHGPAVLGRVPYPGDITSLIKIPSPASAYRVGTIFSIEIKYKGRTIIHHGSAGFIPGMYKGMHTDILLLGIAGMGDEKKYLKETAVELLPECIIPIHSDNFFKKLSPHAGDLFTINYNKFLETAGSLGIKDIQKLPLCNSFKLN
jgi:L-ascorbate metabolism protein UlaG (beta-lactamase superfamily)